MAIDVSGVNPAFVTVFSDTVTTNTTYDANRPNDRNYVFPAQIIGAINPGITVTGFGIRLESTLAGADVSMTNDGAVNINQAVAAVELVGNGGAVTYTGSGSITNSGAGRAIQLFTGGAGTIDVTSMTIVSTDDGIHAELAGGSTGNIDIVTNGTTDVANGHGIDALINASSTGNISVTNNQAINVVAGGRGINAINNGLGNVDVTIAHDISTTGGGNNAVQAQSADGHVSVIMTGGTLHSQADGIQAVNLGTEGVFVDTTLGQIGTVGNPVTEDGIEARALGAAGNVTVNAGTIFVLNDDGIDADLGGTNPGNVLLNVNGPINSVNDNGIDSVGGTAAATRTFNINAQIIAGVNGIGLNTQGAVTINVAAGAGIDATDIGVAQFGSGAVSVVNAGIIDGASGTAIQFGAGADTYDGRPGGTLVGLVLGNAGNDLFFSGAASETFNGGADIDTVDYAGATGPVFISLLVGTASGHGSDTLPNIENARGSSHGDTFIGALGLPNTFTGRGGDDTFIVAPGMGADVFEDLLAGAATEDRVDVRAFPDISSLEEISRVQIGPDTEIAFNFVDVLTLRNVTATDLVDDDFILVPDVPNALWQHDDGRVRTSDNDLGPAAAFDVVGAADFDADGDTDVLFRHPDGHNVIWEIQDGTLLTNHNLPDAPHTWEVAGTGDFDGDLDADILWRNDTAVVTWEIQDNAQVTHHNLPDVPTTFEVVATGDFDADGDDDILWRQDDLTVIWEMEGGAFVTNHNLPTVPTTWEVGDVGDFDGDGDADIVWQNGSSVTIWEIQDNAFVTNHNQIDVPITFHVEATHDLDQDGDDDILWHDDLNGNIVGWSMQNHQLVQDTIFGAVPDTWELAGTGEFDL